MAIPLKSICWPVWNASSFHLLNLAENVLQDMVSPPIADCLLNKGLIRELEQIILIYVGSSQDS